MSTPVRALVALLFTASLTAAGCAGPPDTAMVTVPGDSRSDFVDVPGPGTARRSPATVEPPDPGQPAPAPTAPPSAPAFPEPLRAQAIAGITSFCSAGPEGAVATIGYRALRAGRTDEVELIFRSHNGYVQMAHRRGGEDLGTTQVDVVLTSAPVFPEPAGNGQGQAALMAELPAPGLRPALVAAGVCVSGSMEGRVRRDDEDYFYEPSCDFPEGVMDSVLAAAVAGAARACCASAPGNLSCDACQAGARTAQQVFDEERASAPPAACDWLEPADSAG